jgi:hypothetical protein
VLIQSRFLVPILIAATQETTTGYGKLQKVTFGNYLYALKCNKNCHFQQSHYIEIGIPSSNQLYCM